MNARTPSPNPADLAANPLLKASSLPYQAPPFEVIRAEHYLPAFEAAMTAHRQEIGAIAESGEPPTFVNTLVAMELSGQALDRVERIFSGQVSAHTNPTLEAVQLEMAPKLSAHRDGIFMNPALFDRINRIKKSGEADGLDPESIHLLNRVHAEFLRRGAALDDASQTRLRALNESIATLSARFSQNVLSATNAGAVLFDDKSELDGLSESEISAAANAAAMAGASGKFSVALLNTTVQPLESVLKNRDSRRRLREASVSRCKSGADDNRSIILQLVASRAERARLLGYRDHAHYVTADETSGSPEAVSALLNQLVGPAVANAKKEARQIQDFISAQGSPVAMAPWDWSYYAEQVRRAKYAFDSGELKPYFELNRVLHDGVFFAASQLYGLRFKKRDDIPVYHEDVDVYEVFEEDGTPIALFLTDYYARPSKRGGAWMNLYVAQSELLDQRPVVGNHMNIGKPMAGEPTLLSFTEVVTMFHEFGHALHGMLSNVRYPRFSGTSVPRDFVEFPSQVYEMWATDPTVLASFARHVHTGEAMPEALVEKLFASQLFNEGFRTTEYLAAALLDQAWHQLSPDQIPADVDAFEAQALAKAGADFLLVEPRYRSAIFSHIFAGGYAAGYYAYIWAEVLDADTVCWFKSRGGLKRSSGDHLRHHVLSRGGSAPSMDLYRTCFGGDPSVRPLLERRGLLETTEG